MDASLLPTAWRFRSPQLSDLQAVIDLIAACEEADFGKADINPADLLAEWQRPGFDLSSNARLLLSPDNRLAGYTDFWLKPDEVYISHNTCIHPAYRNQADLLLFFRLGEEISHRHFSGQSGVIRTVSFLQHRSSLLETEGYQAVRVDWRMQIDLDAPPSTPGWPDGFHLRPFVQSQDARAVHEIIQTAFRDITNHQDVPFEAWEQFMLKRIDFDPTLMFVVEHIREIVAVAACFDYSDNGWVRQLAVKNEYRGRGLGLSLLRYAFAEFFRRGRRSVGLIVDSQNPTGAPELYLRAGMVPVEKLVTYKKWIGLKSDSR
jgi:mycothiol synthase